MRIGIFGGCFNPPHKMHKDIATFLVQNDYLDKVIFVPTGNLYHKKGLLEDFDRLQMIQLMIKGDPFLEVSDYEFGKLTYTYQTLRHFQEIYMDDEIYFICGSDNLNEFDTWREYEWILENFKIIVVRRNGDLLDKIIDKYDSYRDNIIICDAKESYLSSTMIRGMFKNNQMTEVIKHLDSDVYNYIMENRLYI